MSQNDDEGSSDDELMWVESIHGSLVVVPLENLEDWEPVERGSTLATTPIVADVLLQMPAAGDSVWVLARQDLVAIVPSEDGIILVQPLSGADLEDDDEAVLALVDGVPAAAWQPTGSTRVLEQGLAIFDACAPDGEAIEETGVLIELEPDTYHVDVVSSYTVGDVVAHLVRFRG